MSLIVVAIALCPGERIQTGQGRDTICHAPPTQIAQLHRRMLGDESVCNLALHCCKTPNDTVAN